METSHPKYNLLLLYIFVATATSARTAQYTLLNCYEHTYASVQHNLRIKEVAFGLDDSSCEYEVKKVTPTVGRRIDIVQQPKVSLLHVMIDTHCQHVCANCQPSPVPSLHLFLIFDKNQQVVKCDWRGFDTVGWLLGHRTGGAWFSCGHDIPPEPHGLGRQTSSFGKCLPACVWRCHPKRPMPTLAMGMLS